MESTKGDRLLKTSEACAMLGICRTTLWQLRRQGVVPRPVKIAGMVRFRESEVQALIDRLAAERDRVA